MCVLVLVTNVMVVSILYCIGPAQSFFPYLRVRGRDEHDDGQHVEELADEDPPQFQGVGDGHDAAREAQEERGPPQAEARAGGLGEEEVQDPELLFVGAVFVLVASQSVSLDALA